MTAIPCICWVRRGVTKSHLDRVRLGDDDLAKIMKDGTEDDVMTEDSDDSVSHDNEDSDGESPKNSTVKPVSAKNQDESASSESDDEIDQRYNLDGYDQEDDETEDAANSDNKGMSLSSLSYYQSIKEDPYVIKEELHSSDEEAEILTTDNILAVGKVKEDFFGLEICVYNDDSRDLFVHHDSILSAFPLAMEWVGYDPGESKPGNLLAIGNTNPDIELWDLDVMDTLEPAFVLRGAQKKKGKKKIKTSEKGHIDAVLDLSWNTLQTNALASASADHTIGLWDLDEGKMIVSIAHHEEKVQALKWHPFEAQTLLSGSFDKTVKVYDCRTTDCSYKSWLLAGEVERVCWNIHNPFCFVASTDTGHLTYIDVRMDKPLFDEKAHGSAISGLSFSCDLAGCLMTCSMDKLVKVWDLRSNQPTLVHTKNYHLEELQCLSMCPDIGTVFAVGGTSEVRVIQLDEDIIQKFLGNENAQSENPMGQSKKKKKLKKQDDTEQITSDSNDEEKIAKKKKKKKVEIGSTNIDSGENVKFKQITSDSNNKERIAKKKKKNKKKVNIKSTSIESDENVKSKQIRVKKKKSKSKLDKDSGFKHIHKSK